MWGRGKDAGEGRKPHSHMCSDMFGQCMLTCYSSKSPESLLGVLEPKSAPSIGRQILPAHCNPLRFLQSKHCKHHQRSCGPPLHPFASISLILPTSKMGIITLLACCGLKSKSVLGEHMQTPALTFIMDGETEAQRDELVVSNLHCALGSPGELVENKDFQVILPAWGRSLVICTF